MKIENSPKFQLDRELYSDGPSKAYALDGGFESSVIDGGGIVMMNNNARTSIIAFVMDWTRTSKDQIL